MLSSLALLSIATLASVTASPLDPRQVTSVATTSVSGPTSTVIATASGTSTAAVTATANGTSASSIASVSPSATGTTGNQTFPGYPCPVGYLLTYVEQNVTLPIPLARTKTLFGNWSQSPFFPNVTNATGASAVGAAHTLNVAGLQVRERLAGVLTNSTTGYLRYTWNLTNGPIVFGGVNISNYSTVLQFSDPARNNGSTTGGNTTFLDTYTNFCASSQPLGMAAVMQLASAELGLFQAYIARASAATTAVTSSTVRPTSTSANSTTTRPANSTVLTTTRPANVTSSIPTTAPVNLTAPALTTASVLNTTA